MEDGIFGRLQYCHKTCCEKGGHRRKQAYKVQRWHHCGDVVFRTGGLVYNSEQFSFYTHDIDYIIKGFGDKVIVYMYM